MADYYAEITLPEPGLHPRVWGHTPDLYLRALYAITRREKPGLFVELGTYRGYSSEAIAEALLLNRSEGHPGTLVTIDWQADFAYNIPVHLIPEIQALKGNTHDEGFRDQVLADYSSLILDGRPRARPIDLLFVDAAHEYESACADYTCWAPFVRPGGMILFHDIRDLPGTARLWEEVSAFYPGRTSAMPGNEMGVLILP